jgi:hypothetical protein
MRYDVICVFFSVVDFNLAKLTASFEFSPKLFKVIT